VTRPWRRAQSLVEFALVAPILIAVAMLVWDGGGVVREQVVLQQAARDGARAGAAGYGASVPAGTVKLAVVESAKDLPGLTIANVSVNYAPDDTWVRVDVSYDHALSTPGLRQVWGGGAPKFHMTASATFSLPQPTPVPSTVVLSTPIPTETPTPTPTPVPTATPVPPTPTPAPPTAVPVFTPTRTPTALPATATPVPPPRTCNYAIPTLARNTGFYGVIQTTSPGTIRAVWTMPGSARSIELDIYAGTPFAGQPNPTSKKPPGGALASGKGNVTKLDVTTGVVPAGTYTVYIYKVTTALPVETTASITFRGSSCP
jgi:hypothetical protein